MKTKQPPIAALDGLRGLACLLVLFCHAGYGHFVPLLVGMGQFGVMLFYTLSGFLMTYHYLPGNFSARYWTAFLAHRFVRVYPAFFLATFGYLITRNLPIHFPLWDGSGWQGLIPGWLLCENRGIFWTIPVEIKFYFMYPLLAYFIFPLSTRRLLISVIITTLFWAALFFLNVMNMGGLAMLMCLPLFLAGIFSAALLKKGALNGIKPVYWKTLSFVGLLGLYFCVAYFRFSHLSQAQLWERAWLFAPLMALILLSLAQTKGLIHWLFSNSLARFIGKISYSLYLTHWFIVHAARTVLPKYLQIPLFVFALVFLTAWLFYLLIERPCTRLAKNLSTRITASTGLQSSPGGTPGIGVSP